MINIKREISRNIPSDVPRHFFNGGTPILTAYGCALLERDTGKTYIYTAVNLTSGKTEVVSRRTNPLTTSGVETMVERLRKSSVAGTGRLEADRLFGEKIALAKCREMLITLFKEILPLHGYAVRTEQIALAEHILDAIQHRSLSLAEAEVGTGKTLAYLVPAVLAKRGRLNGHWNMSFYTGTPYVEMAHMPIVVATSSIALQKAIVTDYIPELSDIMMAHGIIKTPLTAVIRKGREHYICEHNLRAHVLFEYNPKMKKILDGLLKPGASIDIAEIDGLTPHVKRKISVPTRCYDNCPHSDNCAYLRFRTQAQSAMIDIQVCNHNYLLADTLRRTDEQRPLIPNYQSIIIDEAHKFLSAARSMYGVELSSLTLPEVKSGINDLNFKNEEAERFSRKMAKKLFDEGNRLFRGLTSQAEDNGTGEESDRFTADIDSDTARHLRSIRNISDSLIEILSSEPVVGNGAGRKSQLVWELKQINEQTAALARNSELICWLEADKDESRLCAIPKDLDKRLYNDIWSKGIPTIFTSGTLSSNAGASCASDFSHIKRTLGLERVGIRLTETSKPSPFDYRENALLYISENIPFPNQRDKAYITAVADETEKLIFAAHGHAAVLFTSYKAMDMVWEQLKRRGLPFPMFRLDKGGIKEIERFKRSGNGVLFASGALWEGIDIPGDALSLLIIVKLPFAVPDPIGEYEQTLYKDMAEYKRRVIVPEMLIKLKQGFGRLIRTEKDTGAIVILDSRVNSRGIYRERVLNALPDCYVINEISDIENFLRLVKPLEYYI